MQRAGNSSSFPNTHWSVVLVASRPGSPAAMAALEQLCHSYWFPLYAYVRRRGHCPEDCQDLTQEFFLQLLQGPFLSRADRERGRFRSFLLGAFEHFLAKQSRSAQRQKRGGGCTFFSLDSNIAENRFRCEPSHQATPERLYNQSWALTLLESAMAKLRAEWTAAGKSELFEALKGSLDGEGLQNHYRDLALELGMGQGAVRMAVHRLRQRYGELLRAEIAQTVATSDEIDEEIRFLFAALPR